MEQKRYITRRTKIELPNLIQNIINFQFKFKFINYIITLYNIFVFHVIIYKNMSSIIHDKNEKKEKEKLSLDEYTKGFTIRGMESIASNNICDEIKANMLAMESLKPRSYCRRCFNNIHADPSFCPRRCEICLGNHGIRQCDAHQFCSWWGEYKGNHKCNDSNLSSWFLICPLCRLVGHSANNCKPLYLVLSQILGPLKSLLRRKRGSRRRFISKRTRWIGLGRRWRRRWRKWWNSDIN